MKIESIYGAYPLFGRSLERLPRFNRRNLYDDGGTESDDGEIRGDSFGDDVMPQPQPHLPSALLEEESEELVEMRNPAPKVIVRGRTWVFTSFDDTAIGLGKDWLPPIDAAGCVWQIERAPGTGRLHLQGALHFKNARSFEQVKSKLPEGTHIELAKASWAKAAAYCRKEETRVTGPFVWGEDPVIKASYGVNLLRIAIY